MIQKTATIGGAITQYEYDAENKLVRVVSNGTTSNYRYDGLGRRVEKEVISVGTTITRYVYDNEDILLELNGANAIVARYTHGPGIDEPLIMEKDAQSFYYHADGLGSITDLTIQTGTVAQRYTYSSFGKIESQLDPNFVQPYTFTGREFDGETGLYYYRERYYDASVGRFLQQDPLGFETGETNFYLYVRNRPTIWIDPSGLYGLNAVKAALQKVHKQVGKLPKGNPGKHGSPQRGTPEKGYRLDPPHPDAEVGSPEAYPHINWWDYTKGKRKSGKGRKGAEVIEGIVCFIGTLLDPFGAISGELAGPEDTMIPRVKPLDGDPSSEY